jgi:hypothetical protein
MMPLAAALSEPERVQAAATPSDSLTFHPLCRSRQCLALDAVFLPSKPCTYKQLLKPRQY